MNIKDIVKDNTVRFVRYRQGVAYYGVNVPRCGEYVFPVPLDDIGDATLELEDRTIYFMRYIRRAMSEGLSFLWRHDFRGPVAQPGEERATDNHKDREVGCSNRLRSTIFLGVAQPGQSTRPGPVESLVHYRDRRSRSTNAAGEAA